MLSNCFHETSWKILSTLLWEMSFCCCCLKQPHQYHYSTFSSNIVTVWGCTTLSFSHSFGLPLVCLCIPSLWLCAAASFRFTVSSLFPGRQLDKIKAEAQERGDLGLVAESSRSNQRMMFQPASLTAGGVFRKLKEIASMSGNSVSHTEAFSLRGSSTYCFHSADLVLEIRQGHLIVYWTRSCFICLVQS